MKTQWLNEKQNISKVQKLREQIESVNAEIDKAEREYNLDKAAELKYGKRPDLLKQLEAAEKSVSGADDNLLHDRVTEEEIAKIIN